jgi:glycosyltransferase involved in cell wall biosynthesis
VIDASPPAILVVLPAFNAARHLGSLLAELGPVAEGLGAELCVVDDGSIDETAEIARRAGVTVVAHELNRGKGEALKTGFAHALERRAGCVITMDADGQHAPAELSRFVEAWRAGAKVVVGDRMAANTNMPWLRKRTNEFTSWVVGRLAGCRIPDSQNGYRLFDAEVLRSVGLESSRYDLESEILIKAGALGYRAHAVPVSTIYHDEESSIHPVVDTLRFVRLVWRAQRWRQHPGPRA